MRELKISLSGGSGEDTEMESITLSSEGHAGVKKYLEGDRVEVRQREKGLRGSWFPAVVVGVKQGKRVVEYDELLTEDGRQKLTEVIPVGRGVDGARGPSRSSLKSPPNRLRALVRPRPPSTPDATKLTWKSGLWVDCRHKDAWWEGILEEDICSSRKQKRARVYFPEEEDHETMSLKDMRVAQDWDEDLGKWIPRGYSDVPIPRNDKRVRTMSLGRESRGRKTSPQDMELAIALPIEASGCSERVSEYTPAWNSLDTTSPDNYVEKPKRRQGTSKGSVALNSSTSTASSSSEAREENVVHQVSGNDGEPSEEVLETLELDRKEGRVCVEGVCASLNSSSQKLSDSLPSGEDEHERSKSAFQSQPSIDKRSLRSSVDGSVDAEKLNVVRKESPCQSKPTDRTTSSRVLKDEDKRITQQSDGSGGLGNETQGFTCSEGALPGAKMGTLKVKETRPLAVPDPSTAGKVSCKKVGNGIVNVKRNIMMDDEIDLMDLDEDAARELLSESGWNVTKNFRKTGKAQWYYRAPGGTLLGSIHSALKHWKKFQKGSTREDENPTLNDMKLENSVTRDRKVREGSQQSVTPKNGKMKKVFVSNQGSLEVPGRVNGFDGPRPLSPLTGGCSDRISDLRTVDNRDSYESTKSKRSASEVEVELDDQMVPGEQKRRKLSNSTPEQSKSPWIESQVRVEKGQTSEYGFLWGQLSAGNEFPPRHMLTGRDDNMTDVNIVALTSKKRVCTAEEILQDSSNLNADGRMLVEEPRSKKSRAISTDLVCTLEGKSRKSLVTLQESLQNTQHMDAKQRKKPFSPHRSCDFKQTKKSIAQDFKQVKKSAKKSKKSRAPARAGVRLEVLLSAPLTKSDTAAEGDTLLRKRTLLSWLIDNGMVEENEKVRYLNRKDNHCMLEGYVTRDGIRCDCCGTTVTLSVFEAHAGSKLHRPSANIFLSNGKSLSECQVEALAKKTESEGDPEKAPGNQESADKSDDTCGICGDGGELICCDHCPSTFHLNCMGMEAVPDGDWFCPNCRCAICGGSQFNGDKSSFNDLTVIFCDQCECEYHVKCLRSRGIELDCCPKEDWFCGESCGRIFRGLRGLVGVSKPMEGGFSWTLLRSRAEDDRKSGCISNTELNAEHDSKLSIALSVMQECFRPMIDPRTKIDIISHVLYNRGSEVSRLNYHGFYTMLLERGDELISVATIRVHGARLAEMPLIGTRFAYRRQGMCRKLMSALEEMLRSLGVERLVLPAVPELLETWTGAFGFMNMQGSERLQLMDLNIMAFPGTSLLYKPLDKLDASRTDALTTVSMLRAPVEDDRKKFVCPAEARKKRGRLARPRKGNLFGSFLSGVSDEKSVDQKLVSELVTVWVEQVTRFGEDIGCPLYRPASPDGSVIVESLLSEQGVSVRPSAPFQRLYITKVKGDVEARDSGGEVMAKGDELQAKKAATMKILKSVLGVDQSASSLTYPKIEDVSSLPQERSSSEENLSSEEEEFENSLGTRTRDLTTEVKTPGWLIDSIKEAAKTSARPVPVLERNCKTRGLDRQCQNEIPALESATACSTKTYERRRSKLSPHSQREPVSRIRQMELADSDPISRTLDFSSDDLEPVQYYELQPLSVPMRTFPSQFTYQNYDLMGPGTFKPVQTDVVNSSHRGESSLADSWQTGTASSEDNFSGSSYDQRDDYKSRGTGLTVRLKLSNLNLEKKKKKQKKSRSKDFMNVVLEKVPECNSFAEEIPIPSMNAATGSGSGSRSRDTEVASPGPFDQGQSKKIDRVAEPKYISVMVN
ncbi:hypothetical protein Mapa_005828 [Marchantia paleacea]|nr:hypothetical protein Mapa_005828 [Marchantia paleacea]